MWCEEKCYLSDKSTFFHCSMVQFWGAHAHCWLSAVARSHHAHHVCSTAIQLVIHCLFWYHFVRTCFCSHFRMHLLVKPSALSRALKTHDPVASSSLFFPWKTFDRATEQEQFTTVVGFSWLSHLVITIGLMCESLLFPFLPATERPNYEQCLWFRRMNDNKEIINVFNLTWQC